MSVASDETESVEVEEEVMEVVVERERKEM